MDKKKLFKNVSIFLKLKGAKKIKVFGSYARNEEKKGSDIDLIVEFNDGKSLIELVRIERELSKEIGIKVDLLTEESISPYLIERIKKESIVI